jgi:ankyrin repeat protein
MRKTIVAAILLTACNAAPRAAEFSDLCNAVRAGDTASIQQLVAKGADPNAPAGGNDWTPLLHAIHKHQNASVAALVAAGADINRAGRDGVTPLMMAAGYGYDDTVQLLLQRGASATLKSPDGESALDWAMAGTTDIDRFTFFTCQDSTTALLRNAAPSVAPKPRTKRWASMKRCASVS